MATPLPARTAANDKLIMSTPDNLLTQRQRDYADLYHLPTASNVDLPTAAPTSTAPIPPTSSGPAVPDVDPAVAAAKALADQIAADKAEAKAQQQRDAFALVRGTLATYGLPDTLADWAWAEIVAGKGMDEVMLDLRQRPEFKQTFPEIDARLKAGLAPLSPGEIVSYRQQARQMMQAAGLPQGFYDSNSDFSGFLTRDTSLSELSSRITDASNAAYNIPPEDRQAFYDLGYGHGDLTAMFLDPDRAQPLLHKQLGAARLSGAGVRSGYGALTSDEALHYTETGVTPQQAEQGLGVLVRQKELFNPLDAGETEISREDQQAAALGGNAAAQQRITDRARRRVSTFSAGGSYAGSQGGLSGYGTSGR